MNYIELAQAIQDYSENTEALFVANIPRFVKEAEDRIYNSVQLPTLRKNVLGTTTASNQYLSLPSDWLSTYSVAVIDTSGNYTYLLNKDVNFLREAYPNSNVTGTPKYYAMFGPNVSNLESLSAIMAPTPDTAYGVELHYYYYPISIVQGQIDILTITAVGSAYTNGTYYNVPLTGGSGSGATATVVVLGKSISSVTIDNPGSLYAVGDTISIGTTTNSGLGSSGSGSGFTATIASITNVSGTSWVGDNYDPVLFYGAMREAMIFMKGEQDMVAYYEQKYTEALAQLKRLGDGLERNDAYRKGQTSLEYKGL